MKIFILFKQPCFRQWVVHEKLKTAKDITLNLGPYGGFKYLHFTYKDGDVNSSCSVGNKKKAEWFLELFNKYGLEVKEVKEK